MSRPTSKAQLLSESKSEYEALLKFIGPLAPDQMTQPGALGDWSVKDVLAHLTEWIRMFQNWYVVGVQGESPVMPAVGYKWNQLQALNQTIYEQFRLQPLEEVLEQFKSAHQQIMTLVESLPEEILLSPDHFTWTNHHPLLYWLAANMSMHYHWARTEMRKSMKRIGTLQPGLRR